MRRTAVFALLITLLLTGCGISNNDISENTSTSVPQNENNSSVDATSTNAPVDTVGAPVANETNNFMEQFSEQFDIVCSSELRDLIHIKDATFIDDKIEIAFKAFDETTSAECGVLTNYAVESITNIINYDDSISDHLTIQIDFNKTDKHKFISNYDRNAAGDYLNMGYKVDSTVYPDGLFSKYKLIAGEWLACDEMRDGYLGDSSVNIIDAYDLTDKCWDIDIILNEFANTVSYECYINYMAGVGGKSYTKDEMDSIYPDLLSKALDLSNNSSLDPLVSDRLVIYIKQTGDSSNLYTKTYVASYDYSEGCFK
jgi:hypothetical protein